MSFHPALFIYGEVLVDLFPSGERVLGGAPFNVAWHLQALGDAPRLITRVGNDPPGRAILKAMTEWGLDVAGVQTDPLRPTGEVVVEVVAGEPHFRIAADSAYDHIAPGTLPPPRRGDLLYHGTLGLRHATSRETLADLRRNAPDIFLDVNLRPPWWRIEEVREWLAAARWVKLNEAELRMVGFDGAEPAASLAEFQETFSLDQVILTRGALGALVRTADGVIHRAAMQPVGRVIDTVGAGDAFSAVYLHGLRAGWPVPFALAAAQRFAGRVVGLRGATTTDRAFYQPLLAELRGQERLRP